MRYTCRGLPKGRPTIHLPLETSLIRKYLPYGTLLKRGCPLKVTSPIRELLLIKGHLPHKGTLSIGNTSHIRDMYTSHHSDTSCWVTSPLEDNSHKRTLPIRNIYCKVLTPLVRGHIFHTIGETYFS